MIKPYYEEPNIKIYQGHILEVLKALDDESVNTIITSPPYWGLRDYGEDTKTIWDGDPSCEHKWENVIQIKEEWGHGPNRVGNNPNPRSEGHHVRKEITSGFCQKCGAWYGQLGLEPTLDLYISHLLQITAELKRVLRKDGIMFWNQGDNYGGAIAQPNAPKLGKRADDRIYSRPAIGIPKCLCLQNFRLILKMIDEQDWILRNSIIWNKPNHMPSSVKDRFANAYEPVFMFVKQSNPQYYYNIKTILMANRKAKDPKENIDWEWRPCPRCQKDFLAVAPNGKSTYRKSPVLSPCSRCKGTGKIKYSFWRALDYWFDLDAVRLPHAESSHQRYKGKYTGPFAKEKKTAIAYKEANPNRELPKTGKNPGDVWEIREDERAKKAREQSMITMYSHSRRPVSGFKHADDCGDFWTIPTQPFPEAHFATFPEDLVKPMILAGCPRSVCKKCGKARVKITKLNNPSRQTFTKDHISKSGAEGSLRTRQSIPSLHRNISPNGKTKGVYYQGQTIGWTDCGCNAGWTPGIVLDPFVGAGAVLRVAKNLGYAAIGIDIKKEYCDMATKGIKNITPSLPFE